jgi:SAM-dependent methyltransferase
MSMDEEIRKLQAYLNRELSSKGPVRILEAGCGSTGHLDFGIRAGLVGIDISEKQLERNALLHEKILGDIQRYEFPPETFDFIICWDVLEHLPNPEMAMLQFSRAIKPGGLVILKLPNIFSLKGLVTKFLPHTFHVFAYRFFYGDKNAGKKDRAPFKTYLRFRISANALQNQGTRLGLRSVAVATFDVAEMNWLRQKKGAYFVYLAMKHTIGFLSLGRIGDSELIIVMRKELPSNDLC